MFPAPFSVPTRQIWIVAYLTVNVYLIVTWMQWDLYVWDWDLWDSLPTAISSGTLYHSGLKLDFVWSPLIAPLQALFAISGFGRRRWRRWQWCCCCATRF